MAALSYNQCSKTSMQAENSHSKRNLNQFSVLSLMEFATLCAVLAALFRISGVIPCALLMGMALALGARQGLVAIVMLAGALIAADMKSGNNLDRNNFSQVCAVFVIAAGLTGWYLLRRKLSTSTGNDDSPDAAEIKNPPASPL
jgi:hypothetical protein